MSKKSKRKTITFHGTTYTGTMEKGKLVVRTDHTAHGQRLLAGTYDFDNNAWELQNKRSFPIKVREEMVQAFRA